MSNPVCRERVIINLPVCSSRFCHSGW